MIKPGDVMPRRDTDRELFVVVLSNAIHLAAGTGRLVVCPFIPGELPSETMSLVVSTQDPEGATLPELVHWLPLAALDDAIANIGTTALAEASATVAALIS
ncbi:toxin [Mycobacterium sp.]|uniref:toxin n=1 Tax=Mycobacterium sp. TaxID=1785 RepID=UPI0025EDCD03|nr:toxin [Mycobacterium sp.]